MVAFEWVPRNGLQFWSGEGHVVTGLHFCGLLNMNRYKGNEDFYKPSSHSPTAIECCSMLPGTFLREKKEPHRSHSWLILQ